MAINKNRRSTLKAMTLATGASLGAVVAPSIAVAVCKHGVGISTVASTPIRGTGLVVSFGEKPSFDGSRQVVVTNTNDQPVTLSQIYPGIVSTPDGQYDLNSLLVNGSVQFAAKQVTTLTIQATLIDHQNNRLNDKIDQPQYPMRTADSLIHVRTTNAGINGGQPVTTVREVFS